MANKKKEAPITGITISKEEDFSGWFTDFNLLFKNAKSFKKFTIRIYFNLF